MSRPRVLLATRNEGKLAELRRILTPAVPDVEVIGLGEVAPYPEVAETACSFEGNALLKARAAAAATGLVSLADDSGLCVDVLNGLPGVLSARWAGRRRDDAANNALLLDQLADVPTPRRGAAFRCAVAVVRPTGEEKVVTGEVRGRIGPGLRGSGGFGYDPLFLVEGGDRTTAELSPAEKDAVSHRGRALRAAAPVVLAAVAG